MNNMRKILSRIFLGLFISASCLTSCDLIPGFSNDKITDREEELPEGLILELRKDGYYVCGYEGKKNKLKIPNTYEGEDIIGIDPCAFEETTLQSIELPDYLEVIGDYAFANSDTLREIIFPKRQVKEYNARLGLEGTGYECVIKYKGTADDWAKLYFENPEEHYGCHMNEIMVKKGIKYVYPTEINIPTTKTKIGYELATLQYLEKLTLHNNITEVEPEGFGLLHKVEITFLGTIDEWINNPHRELYADFASLIICENGTIRGDEYEEDTPISSNPPISSEPIHSSEDPIPPSSNTENVGTIQISVDQELVNFYSKVLAKYSLTHPELAYNLDVVAGDAGTVADTVIKDGEAAPDIFTVPHVNIGKLTEAYAVLPYINNELLAQIEDDNPTAFKDVIEVDGLVYAAPYISQSLVLMYDKTKVTDEQAKSFEGLKQAAVAAGNKAITFTGADGYNFSAFTLARRVSDKSTTVKLYEGGNQQNCYFQGEDTFQITKWAQSYFADPNGGMFPSDAGWFSEVQNGKVNAVIGGPWHFADFQLAVGGAKNTGITILPTFTAGGVEYRAGSFVDCKVLMMNAYTIDENKYEAVQDIVQYMTCPDVQNEMIRSTGMLPSYIGASDYLKTIKDELDSTSYQGAVAQSDMGNWGIAQPFDNSIKNTFYYSKGAPDVYNNIILSGGAYSTDAAIRKGLYQIEYIWQFGEYPYSVPSSLPSDVF